MTDWACKRVGHGRAPVNITDLAYSMRTSAICRLQYSILVSVCYAIVDFFVYYVLVVVIELLKNDGLLSWLGRASV